jgi:hypothetical protein
MVRIGELFCESSCGGGIGNISLPGAIDYYLLVKGRVTILAVVL